MTQWETGIGIACGLTGLALAISQPPFEGWLTVIFLAWQMCLYLAAPAYSLLSERGIKPIHVTSAGDIGGKVIPEAQAARWSIILTSLLLFGFLLFSLLPPPTETPAYAKLAPVALDSQKIFKPHPVPGKPGKKPDKPGKKPPGKPGKPPGKPGKPPGKPGKPKK